MLAIVYKADGVPFCCQVSGISPDPVVWTTEEDAESFIESKGGGADLQPIAVSDESMDAMAKALGLPGRESDVRAIPGVAASQERTQRPRGRSTSGPADSTLGELNRDARALALHAVIGVHVHQLAGLCACNSFSS